MRSVRDTWNLALLRQCGAAIIVFTPNEELRSLKGEPVWRPSQNMVHELGAAGMLYGNCIVIFREDRVDTEVPGALLQCASAERAMPGATSRLQRSISAITPSRARPASVSAYSTRGGISR